MTLSILRKAASMILAQSSGLDRPAGAAPRSPATRRPLSHWILQTLLIVGIAIPAAALASEPLQAAGEPAAASDEATGTAETATSTAEIAASTAETVASPAETAASPAETAASPAETAASPAETATSTAETAASGAEPSDPAAQPDAGGESAAASDGGEPLLRFSFSGAPWREVLNWLAEESELALHVSDVPVGSFTYIDPEAFSTDQAIARLNLFLIPQGYTIVRRGKLLSVIGLGDPRSLQQLDALAALTSVDDLDKLSEHEVVKCLVPLGDVRAEDATAELRPLMLMNAPVVLPTSNQLMITETAGKLKSVLAVLRAMDLPKVEEVVRRFDLKHVGVETVMMVAGTHLELSPGQNEGIGISISADVTGKTLYVTGSPQKVARLETLLQVLDVAGESSDTLAAMKLRSHPVSGDNLQAVYDVLQTTLAGKSLRLSMQPNTGSIVALAEDSVHQEIESTIAELQAPAIDFAVIDLNTLDPYFVVTLIGEMFEIPSQSETKYSSSRRRDEEIVPSTAPKVDADPGNRRLFVRGTSQQIEQIRQMVDNLDTQKNTRKSAGDAVRVLPLRGQRRQQVLEAAERYWRGDNRVLILPADDADGGNAIERTIHPDQPRDQPVSAPATPRSLPADAFEADAAPRPNRSGTPEGSVSEALVSIPADAAEQQLSSRVPKAGRRALSPIHGQLIPEGIMIQSEDVAALDEFQQHLMDIVAARNQSPSPPVVYYLKYVNAEDAVKMLADLLDGGNSLAETPAGSLINAGGLGSRAGGYFGSLTMKREGMTTVTAGTATIVSDARLNRLIVQGTNEDVAVIDGYLQIVDKGNSITSIETFGRSHVIELSYAKAADVAEVVRQAFTGRVATGPQAGAPQQGRPGERSSNDSRRDSDADRRRSGDDPQRSVADKPTRGREPEMSVAVHEPSNSLVITAPDALFAEVESLIHSVDTRSEQVVEVIPAAAGIDLETILMGLNGEAVSRGRSTSSSSSGSSSRNNNSSSSSSYRSSSSRSR